MTNFLILRVLRRGGVFNDFSLKKKLRTRIRASFVGTKPHGTKKNFLKKRSQLQVSELPAADRARDVGDAFTLFYFFQLLLKLIPNFEKRNKRGDGPVGGENETA